MLTVATHLIECEASPVTVIATAPFVVSADKAILQLAAPVLSLILLMFGVSLFAVIA